jgi:uncharacterized protein YuzE
MAKEIAQDRVLNEVFKATPHLLKFPVAKMWMDYDKEADVLYISFKRPQKATDLEMLEKGILLRYKGDELVGLTVLETFKR